MQKYLKLSLLGLVFMVACNEEKCRESSVEASPEKLQVERLEEELFKAKSAGQVEAIFRNNPGFAIGFLDADQYPSEDIVAQRFFNLINDPSIDTLYQEVEEEYNNFSKVEEQLSCAFGKLKKLYPQTEVPKIQTVVTGLYRDISFSDSLIVIGLDHFLGENAKYKPLDVPDYIYKRYSKKHMAAIVMSFVAGQHNKSNLNDKTMLAEMIDYGKTYYLVSQLLPCVPENIIIGYTDKEWSDSESNDDIIWANIIENELLYEVNHTKKNKFMGERPNVFEIGEDCPGRIGRWVGWQIVNAYMNQNPQTTIQQLMDMTSAQLIFEKSKYKPRN
jgi:gliding motility-associated lipoprotein GldB